MRPRALAAAVACAAAAVLAVPAPALAAPTDAGVLVVYATGEPAVTTFATAANRVYRITVSGAYTYNAGGNLADCGWWNPEGTTEWYDGGFFQVDRSAAACTRQAYSPAHTYTWDQQGTGRPFEFSVWDPLPYDNVGAFTVAVAEVGADPHQVVGDCQYVVANNSQEQIRVFTVLAEGRATGAHEPPTSLRVTCRFTGPGGTATVSNKVAGPVVAASDVVILDTGDYQVCWYVEAHWLDYHARTYSDCKEA